MMWERSKEGDVKTMPLCKKKRKFLKIIHQCHRKVFVRPKINAQEGFLRKAEFKFSFFYF